MARIPIALQLYSVREDCQRDLEGTLQAVAEMGYEGVEFAGYYGRTAPELRALLDRFGLKVAGTHAGYRTVTDGELAATIGFNQIIGNPYLVVPSLPAEHRVSLHAWQDSAHFLASLAEKVQPHGLRAGFHSHAAEFQPVDVQMPWDVIAAHSSPAVILQLDLGNTLGAGVNPLPFLEKYIDRAVTVHLKDRSSTNPNALIGEGEIDWPEVFRLCESSGVTEWYIVEQERYAYPPLECVRRCLDSLRAMGR